METSSRGLPVINWDTNCSISSDPCSLYRKTIVEKDYDVWGLVVAKGKVSHGLLSKAGVGHGDFRKTSQRYRTARYNTVSSTPSRMCAQHVIAPSPLYCPQTATTRPLLWSTYKNVLCFTVLIMAAAPRRQDGPARQPRHKESLCETPMYRTECTVTSADVYIRK
jgi:hypothetical protein